MNKETIQKKKETLEVEFKKIEGTRQKAQDIINQANQQLIRLQGAYAQLLELENEFDEGKDKNIEKKSK